ncbi:MAG TPA: IS4 family transposase, partial [Kofleriaceae bacterium]|nr:IS4 family transposase [Kofleriaceae bacterium]
MDTFGHADLGDCRRVHRVVAMAAQLVQHPAGRITAAFGESAAREAAYRFVENDRFSVSQLSAAMFEASARQASAWNEIIVPVDGVNFTVAHAGPGFGPVCIKHHAQGAHAMTALALTPDGVPLGVLGQVFWTRSAKRAPVYAKDRRPIAARETGYWLTAITQACEALQRHAPTTRPWFQLDRGGDCADVLLHALGTGANVTVRACYDRVVTGGKLWGKAARGTYLGSYQLRVAKPGQRPRLATLHVRARLVELHLRPGGLPLNRLVRQHMWVVEARELRRSGVLWRLLTTKPATTLAQACHVIAAYTRRWRIEELHLAWKSGACGIEQSWLRRREHFYKWATITCAVAARLERIKLLSRTEPDRNALDEFSRDEIDAAIALRKPK